MNLVYKILFFSILSISFPIGKLLDIFIWNDSVKRTEVVIKNQNPVKKKICFFVKIAKEIQKKRSTDLQNRFNFAITERLLSKRNIQLLSVQNNKVNNNKTLLIKQFIFNIIYLDDSEFSTRNS